MSNLPLPMQNNFIHSPIYMRCTAPVLQYMRVIDFFRFLPRKLKDKLPCISFCYSSDPVEFDMVRLEKWYQAYMDYVFYQGKSRVLSSYSQQSLFLAYWHDLRISSVILKVV